MPLGVSLHLVSDNAGVGFGVDRRGGVDCCWFRVCRAAGSKALTVICGAKVLLFYGVGMEFVVVIESRFAGTTSHADV